MYETDRANTKEQKKQVLDRLYKLWLRHPQLRLGQLIQNVFEQAQISIVEIPRDGKRQETQFHAMEIFFIEDFPFIQQLEDTLAELENKEVD